MRVLLLCGVLAIVDVAGPCWADEAGAAVQVPPAPASVSVARNGGGGGEERREGAEKTEHPSAAPNVPLEGPHPVGSSMTPTRGPGGGVTAGQGLSRRGMGVAWPAQVNFSRQQRILARRVFGVSPVALFGVVPPPEVVTSGFGLLVERRFGL
jgi:hypothetical protein